jgi:hypothetical protein
MINNNEFIFKEGFMNNNLQVVDSYEEDGEKIYYITRINEKLSWPKNWVVAMFAMQSEKDGNVMKKYRVLSMGDNSTIIIAVKI